MNFSYRSGREVMSALPKSFGAVALVGVAFLGAPLSATAQMRATRMPLALPQGAMMPAMQQGMSRMPPMPIFTPSVVGQSVNPNFRISPTLTLPQAAFNTAMIGRALSQVPPYAFGYSPYPQVANFGPVFPGMNPYGMGSFGYGGAMMTTGMYGSYYPMGSSMMTNPYGGYAGMSMTTPYTAPTAPAAAPAGGQAASYPMVTPSQGVADARLVNPTGNSTLVSASRPQRPAKTRDVWIYDNFFSPATLLVPAGTTVRWINYGFHTHTVTAQSGAWESGPVRRGAEFSLTFTEPGTYRYSCRFHPGQMAGTITVTK
jgi:plastocyanin